MLYDRWREIAGRQRRDRALVDLAAGQSWTFGALLDWSDRAEAPSVGLVHPMGRAATFLLEVLCAWRHGCLVCPLEVGQTPPCPGDLPAGWCHLKATSATTGTARWVGFTAEQLVADPANLVTTMGLRQDWPNLGVLSLAHSYGFSSLVLPLLLHGIPLILAASGLPEDLRRASQTEPNLTLPAVPALWRSWQDAGAISPSVRLAISAGAPLPIALERAVYDGTGIKIHNFYGATECGGIAYDATEVPREDSSLVGTAIGGVSLCADSDQRLVVAGANVGTAYWPEPDRTLHEGRFRTTDLVNLDRGQVRLLGRADDLINVAGRKVAPDEIERVVLGHPGVRQCVVFGVPRREAEHGDAIVAVVEPAGNLTREDLASFLAQRVPEWQVPRDWWFVETLPADHRGKWRRREWRERYAQR